MYTVHLVWAVQMAQPIKGQTHNQKDNISWSYPPLSLPQIPPDTTYTSSPFMPSFFFFFFLFNPLSPVKLSAWMLTGFPGLILSRKPKNCSEFLGAMPSQVQRTAFHNASTSSGSFALFVPRGIDKAVLLRSTQQSLVRSILTNHAPTLTTTHCRKIFSSKGWNQQKHMGVDTNIKRSIWWHFHLAKKQ